LQAENASVEKMTAKMRSSLIGLSQYNSSNRMRGGRPQISVKRVYDKPARTDGARILVDRLWPRGLKKEQAQLDAWLRDVAPSNELRKWFHEQPEQWIGFRKRYLKELAEPEAAEALQELYTFAAQRRHMSLLFASKNVERNNATVLKDLLEGMRKPPTGTGPVKASARERKIRRMPRR
jgi:uncharacterized protein YeaO (DUF488 family)